VSENRVIEPMDEGEEVGRIPVVNNEPEPEVSCFVPMEIRHDESLTFEVHI
jgi:hypothetical protein